MGITSSSKLSVIFTLCLMLILIITSFLLMHDLETEHISSNLNTQPVNGFTYSWSILIGGLILVVIVGTSLILATYRAAQLQKISRELSLINAELADEIKERQRAQRELIRQRQEYRTIFDAVPIIISYNDIDGRIKRINRAGAEIMGSIPKEIVGKTLHEICPADIASDFLQLIKSVTASGESIIDHIGHYTLPAGKTLWAHIDIIPFQDLTGKIAGAISVVEDITEQKKSEDLVRESEQRYRSLFENNPDAVYSFDIEGNFLSVNNPTCLITGYSREELLKISFDQLMVKDELEPTRQHFIKASQGGTQNYQTRIMNKSGKIIFLDVTNSPIIVNNRIAGVYGVARDITEQKNAQDAIAESEAKFHSLAEESPSIIGIILKSGQIGYINRKGPEMLGYSKEEFYSPEFDCYKLIATEDIERAKANYKRHLDGEESVSSEYQLIAKDGKRFTSLLNTRLIKYANDTAILGVAADITYRKHLEEKLSKSNESLKRALNDTVDIMAKIVELRDPYTAGHQLRVASLAKAIAANMGLQEQQIYYLIMAAKIHDIGKMYIPSDILSKPGQLTKIEFQLIQTHPKGGHDIIANINFPFPVALMILQHHERLDGSGYPYGLTNPEILLESRILAVADVVEAMSSHRPYRPALGIDKALEEISKYSGTLYDPDVVDACIRLFDQSGFIFNEKEASGFN